MPKPTWYIENVATGKVIDIQNGVTFCGRNKRATVNIESCYASKIHALLLVLPYFVYVKDLNSTNGTYINDTVFRDCNRRVQIDDHIGFGADIGSSVYVLRKKEVVLRTPKLYSDDSANSDSGEDSFAQVNALGGATMPNLTSESQQVLMVNMLLRIYLETLKVKMNQRPFNLYN